MINRSTAELGKQGLIVASFYVCRRDSKECRDCGFCTEHFVCPGVGKPSLERFETACIDCGVCLVACPHQAVERVKDTVPCRQVKSIIDDTDFAVPERITVKQALELLGLEFSSSPERATRFLLHARLEDVSLVP